MDRAIDRALALMADSAGRVRGGLLVLYSFRKIMPSGVISIVDDAPVTDKVQKNLENLAKKHLTM